MRRGVWKRVKKGPADTLEAAETQNIGKHLYNSVVESDKQEGEKHYRLNDETTTVKNSEPESTETPLEHVFSETTTAEPEIEAPKPGMFDEARKALTELFSTEEDSDDGVNMEEADGKLEALLTTTQIPPIEESTTTFAPNVEVFTTKTEESLVNASSQVKTSTSQRVTGEICYRGRCIKTDEKK